MMLVSKERAEYLAQLSYEYCTVANCMSMLMTYKRALEYDSNTAEKIIKELEGYMDSMQSSSYLRGFGASADYFADEIIEIDNYQYVDSYEYDYCTNSPPSRINVNMYEGDKFDIWHSNLEVFGMKGGHYIYAPNIYGIFPYQTNEGITVLRDPREWELYLKLLIIEDREINPYRVNEIGTYTILPMREKLKWLKDYQEEINIVNKVLSKCNGKLIKEDGSKSFYMTVKPTVLYLEAIGEERLADELRKHQNNELHLNYVIERASHKAYGLVAVNKQTYFDLL